MPGKTLVAKSKAVEGKREQQTVGSIRGRGIVAGRDKDHEQAASIAKGRGHVPAVAKVQGQSIAGPNGQRAAAMEGKGSTHLGSRTGSKK